MKLAVCPGSFDPITRGHLDIIKRASTLFDQVIVLVTKNPDKATLFTPDERIQMIMDTTKDIKNLKYDCCEGLLAYYTAAHHADAIVKGLRAMTDFEYEFQMSLTNKILDPGVETVFLTTSSENMFLSSSMVKQVARLGGDISAFVPAQILSQIQEKIKSEER